jgi:protein-disulfide isomerase
MSSSDRVQSSTRSFLSGLAVLTLALGVWLPACAAQDAPKDKMAKGPAGDAKKVVAVVSGQQITEADVYTEAAADFSNLEREYSQNKHQLLENKLKQIVQDRMVEAEAKAKGVSKDQLLADAVKTADVTDADVDKFYEENKAQIPRPKDQVAPQIKQYLQQQRQRDAQTAFIKSLEDKYKAEYLLEPIRVEVASAGHPAKGPATAPVTIVEFSDFQCPFCSRVVPTMEQVRSKYGDKVRLVFRQFPLAFHQNAQKAAEASLCANDQGKFWEMHDAMFANQQALAVDALKAKATELGLNAETFNSCLDSNKHAAAVKADLEAGAAAGVSGTPAMFINGRFISGAVPIEQITQVVDDELKRAERGMNKGK